jgi:DNA-binding transcriptional LysR family regulator
MRLDDFQTFLVIARTLNLHRAADELKATQSAMSKAVKRLETQYGIQLLARTGHGLTLTPAGETLRERAAHLVNSMHDIDSELTDIKTAASGKIRLGTSPGILDMVISPAIARFRTQQPKVRFEVNVQVSQELFTLLRAGLLDLAIAPAPDKSPEGLNYDIVTEQSYYVVARRDHPLCRRRIKMDMLASTEWILPPGDLQMRMWIDTLFAEHRLGPLRVAIETRALPALLSPIVRQTNLLTVMTRSNLDSPMAAGLAALKLPPWQGRLGIFWRRAGYLSPAVKEFLDIVRTLELQGT